MNLKQSIAVGFAVTALFASFGCGGGGRQGGSSPSQSASVQQKKPLDEATIKILMKKLESPNIAEKKEACPMEKLPVYTMIKTPLFDYQAKMKDEYFGQKFKIENLSVSDLKQDGDFASAHLSYTTEANQSINGTLRFVRMDGKWCVNPSNIKSAKALKVSGYDASQLEAAANLGYTYENDPVVFLDVRSKTSIRYKGGWTRPASFTLITDAGEFPAQNVDGFVAPARPFDVSSAEPARILLPFKGATGTPKAIRIVGFNELNSRGLPVNQSQDDTLTFTLSE